MTLPVLSKSWVYLANQTIPAQGTTLATKQKMLRAIKNGLKGFASAPWTHVASSDSVATSSGTDLWDADTDLVWANAGSAHSWIVLAQTGIAAGFQLLISCEGADANGRTLTIVVSPSVGFTGGTITARPTASDEVVIISNVHWEGSFSSNVQFVFHLAHSTDGQCTRFFIYQANLLVAFGIFDKAANPVTGWTIPWVGFWFGTGTTPAASLALLTNVATAPIKARLASTDFLCWFTVEAASGASLSSLTSFLTGANDISGEWPIFTIGLISNTVGVKGKHGTVFDLFYGLAASGEGDTYPNDATKQFVTFGDLVHPWNGTTLVTT